MNINQRVGKPMSSFQKSNLKKANSQIGLQPLIKTVVKKQFIFPAFIKAKSGSVIIPDLKLTVGKTPIDLHARFGNVIPNSRNLIMAINTGLIVDASKDVNATKLPDLDSELDKPKASTPPVKFDKKQETVEPSKQKK